MDLRDLPAPASKEAKALGCTCPEKHQAVMWRGKIVYVIAERCPIHGESDEEVQ